MVKKGTSRGKESVQRNKQAQWQRRVAAVGGTSPVVSATPDGVEADGLEASPVGMGTAGASTAARTGSAGRTTIPRSRVPSPMSSGATGAAARRPATTATRGSARLRMAANQMSIEDEMTYVRGDIRRLIILASICLVVLLALAFVIR